MPPLTGPPSSSMSANRGTTVRHAAARVDTADASTQVGSSALLSSRRAYWTNEQQQLQQSFERYHSHRQELLQLPYPTPPAAERPPPVSATVPIHRVYILRCATCDTFLSDRGMRVSAFPARSRLTGMLVASLVARVIKQDLPKESVADHLPLPQAVLLLKPHIILFSTDSAPANSATFWPDGPAQEQVERTCDCLTSSINCHGCGKTVGCTFISLATLVVAETGLTLVPPLPRQYRFALLKVQRELLFFSLLFVPQLLLTYHTLVGLGAEASALGKSPPFRLPPQRGHRSRTNLLPWRSGSQQPIVRLQPSPTPSRDSSRTPTPLSRARERVEASADKDAPSVRLSRLRTSSPAARARDRGLRLLKPGDTVYWHMLVTGGERAQSIDPRLREPIWRENEGR